MDVLSTPLGFVVWQGIDGLDLSTSILLSNSEVVVVVVITQLFVCAQSMCRISMQQSWC